MCKLSNVSNPSSKIIQILKHMWDIFSSIALTKLVATWIHWVQALDKCYEKAVCRCL